MIIVTERVFPRLALNFISGALDNRISFTRTTNSTNPATYVNSSGVITNATNNQARFDYNPATLACRGLLIEESSTNICLQSQDITTTWLTQNTPTLSSNVAVAPDGTTTADSIQSTSPGSYRRIYQNCSVPANSTTTASWFVKKEISETNYGGISIALSGGTSKNAYIAVNAVTGATAVLSASSITPTVTTSDYGTYWRIAVTTVDTFSNTTAQIQYYATISANFSSLSTLAGSARVIWGAQLEVKSFATSYIPTTTTALARNADVATMTGTNFSDWWQAGRGGAIVRYRTSTVSGTRPVIQFDDNTANNIIALRGNTTNPELYIKATTDQAQIDAGTIAANTTYNLTGWWATNNCWAQLNGGPRVGDSSATIPTVSQMRIGSDGTNYLNGWLESIDYYKALGFDYSEELRSFTEPRRF